MDTLSRTLGEDFASALLQFRDGKLDAAAEAFACIFAADPNHDEAVRHLGLIAHRIGNQEQAAELLAQAILLNPNSGQAFADLGAVLGALGRHLFAVRALQTATTLGLRSAPVFTDLGDALFHLGQAAEAARAYRSALELEPDCAAAQAGLARAQPRAQPTPTAGILTAPVQPAPSSIPGHWRRVQLVLIEPDGYPHMAGLADLVAGFASALAELGLEAGIVRNQLAHEGINVVFGAHLIGSQADADGIRENTVIVNLEPLRGGKLEALPVYLSLLKRLAVWDYSPRNIAEMKALTGNVRIHHVGIGFAAGMQRIAPAAEQTTDVLFYGSLNERRRAVLQTLQQAGLRVRHLFNVYGEERDRAIAEAKVVLNMHYYEDAIHEIVRTSHLLANAKAVVCERNAHTEIEEDIARAMVAVPYDELTEATIALVRDEERRARVQQEGFALFARRNQATMLARAIAETSPPLPRLINLGSGKAWMPNYLNIDIDPKWGPDLLADISDAAWLDRPFLSQRLGLQRLAPESFDAIVTMDVLEHAPALPAFMTSCLALLRVGGKMLINVPYDLSYGAWQDPTHVRAFNEQSWLYYTDWHWYVGWTQARFDVEQLEMVLSAVGQQLVRSMPAADVYRQPRAVDAMKVVLVKRRLTEAERATALQFHKGAHRPLSAA